VDALPEARSPLIGMDEQWDEQALASPAQDIAASVLVQADSEDVNEATAVLQAAEPGLQLPDADDIDAMIAAAQFAPLHQAEAEAVLPALQLSDEADAITQPLAEELVQAPVVEQADAELPATNGEGIVAETAFDTAPLEVPESSLELALEEATLASSADEQPAVEQPALEQASAELAGTGLDEDATALSLDAPEALSALALETQADEQTLAALSGLNLDAAASALSLDGQSLLAADAAREPAIEQAALEQADLAQIDLEQAEREQAELEQAELEQAELEQAADTLPALALDDAAPLLSLEEPGRHDAVAIEQPAATLTVDGVDDSEDALAVDAAPLLSTAAAEGDQPSVDAAMFRAGLAENVAPSQEMDFDALDHELVDIFVEEGKDLLDHCDGLISDLRQAPENREVLAGLQRDLHTLKGGARMAGINPVGDLAHGIEFLLEAVAADRTTLGPADLRLLEVGFDRLHQMLTLTACPPVCWRHLKAVCSAVRLHTQSCLSMRTLRMTGSSRRLRPRCRPPRQMRLMQSMSRPRRLMRWKRTKQLKSPKPKPKPKSKPKSKPKPMPRKLKKLQRLMRPKKLQTLPRLKRSTRLQRLRQSK
jgi:chemosensory pili system protein ChpA (sensor histidine kinase/response regulator)